MTATTTMSMPTTTALDRPNRSPDVIERFFSWGETAFCAPRSIESLANEKAEVPDVLDYVFEHVESFTCTEGPESESYEPQQYKSPHEQLLHQQLVRRKQGYVGSVKDSSFDLSLRRENSLVESGSNGVPYILPTTRNPSSIERFGQDGDILDYCFDHVESFVCTEGREIENPESYPSGKGSPGSPKTPRSPKTPLRNTTNQQRHNRNTESPGSTYSIPSEISTRGNKKKRRPFGRKQNYYPDEEDNVLLYYRPSKGQ